MKNFYILRNGNHEKILYIFPKESFCYITGNENPKKLLKFQEVTFQAWKIKKIHPGNISYTSGNRSPPKTSYIFSKVNFLYVIGNGNPKKRLIFQEVTFQARKSLYFPP